MSAVDHSREDEDFTVLAGLIFLSVGLAVFGILLCTAWIAFDRWGDLARLSTEPARPFRAERRP